MDGFGLSFETSFIGLCLSGSWSTFISLSAAVCTGSMKVHVSAESRFSLIFDFSRPHTDALKWHHLKLQMANLTLWNCVSVWPLQVSLMVPKNPIKMVL